MTPTVHEIQDGVANWFGIKRSDLTGPSRNAIFARPRNVAFALCKDAFGMTYSDIGRRFGGRDHSTVWNGIKTLNERADPEEQRAFAELSKSIPQKFSATEPSIFYPAFTHTVTIARRPSQNT